MNNIKRYFNVINKSLFRIDGTLDYDRVTDAIIGLANTLADTETDENVWYIGEFGACCLGDLIVGAYWHYTEWHSGQWSKGYEALSALGRVFSPGMTAGPEPESSEFSAYQALEAMAQ